MIGPKLSIAIEPSTISVTNSAGDRSAVRARDAGRGAARYQQAQTFGVDMHEAAEQRRAERGKLHHRALAADRATGGDRDQRRAAAPQALSHGYHPFADGHRFHIVGMALAIVVAPGRQQ
jgi:hypothetical protein